MKFLHISFHVGCNLEIKYVFTQMGHTVEELQFDKIEEAGEDKYRITHKRAQYLWDTYKDYFFTFDGIITSDTCPNSRPFLQNHWPKLLIVWVCNRFDYAVEGDQSFYDLLRDIPNRKNVYIRGYTAIENVYSTNLRNVDITQNTILPLGKNLISEGKFKIYNSDDENIFYVPTYHNETKYMNLSQKLNDLGIKNENKRFGHVSDLLQYKGIICIPYAWSIMTFFEVMQLGIIYFVPSIPFLVQLSRGPNFWFQPPYNYDPSLLRYAEFYSDAHKDLVIYFDSWDDLANKIKTTDYEKQTEKILQHASVHNKNTLSQWAAILTEYNKNYCV